MIEQRQYTNLAATLAQFNAWLADRASNPFESNGVCVACGATGPHHTTDCAVARLLTLSTVGVQVRFIGQWIVNDRIVNMFGVMGKRALDNGDLFMYNVNAIATGSSLKPHTTCSCGHCKPSELCDHAMRVETYLRFAGKILKAESSAPATTPTPSNKGDHDGYADPDYGTLDHPKPILEFASEMPEMRPHTEGDYVAIENLSAERIAELQKIVGGGPTPELPFDSITGKCGKCGGVWGHEMNCGWA